VASKGKSDSETLAKQYWTRKEVSLKDIAVDLAYAVVIVYLSRLIGNFSPDGFRRATGSSGC